MPKPLKRKIPPIIKKNSMIRLIVKKQQQTEKNRRILEEQRLAKIRKRSLKPIKDTSHNKQPLL